jgi:hypothetical protein
LGILDGIFKPVDINREGAPWDMERGTISKEFGNFLGINGRGHQYDPLIAGQFDAKMYVVCSLEFRTLLEKRLEHDQ